VVSDIALTVPDDFEPMAVDQPTVELVEEPRETGEKICMSYVKSKFIITSMYLLH